MRISGNRYSTAVGNATDSNRHTTAYAIRSAQVQTNDHPGPKAACVYTCSPPALGIAATSSEYVSPMKAIATPPAANAINVPSDPAFSTQ